MSATCFKAFQGAELRVFLENGDVDYETHRSQGEGKKNYRLQYENKKRVLRARRVLKRTQYIAEAKGNEAKHQRD